MSDDRQSRALKLSDPPASDSGAAGWRYWVTVSVIAVVYFGAAKFGLSLAFVDKQVTAVWPPTGIALVALLLLGNRMWPGILIGAFLINVITGTPLTAIGLATGNTLEAVAGAFLLRRFGFNTSLDRLQDVFGLIGLAALLSTTLSATVGVISLCFGGMPWANFGSVWFVWWLGDAMGDVLVAPFLLCWARRPRIEWRGWRFAEMAALFAGLGAISSVVLTGRLLSAPNYSSEYLVFPFIIWAALRFGQRETVTAVIVISGVAVWGAIHDVGPFSVGTLNERLNMLVIFMGVVAVTAMALGAVTAERKLADADLRQSRDQLEVRVRERTRELAEANVALKSEVTERKKKEEDLRLANEKLSRRTKDLARKNEEVEAFAYIVSHDLRAPLVNIQGFASQLDTSCRALMECLRTATLPPKTQTSVQTIIDEDILVSLRFIRASTDKFQRLIDALLTLSRTGQQDYKSEEIDVAALVRATLDSLRQNSEKGGTQVTLGPLPRAVGDLTAIGQVFSNLIANALNYLQPGRPGVIEIGGEIKDGMNHYWVCDNGVGIPETAQSRLFQIFQRFHPKLAPGEGMGLAITKRIVERHGGKIWVESQENIGTTFHFALSPDGEGRPSI